MKANCVLCRNSTRYICEKTEHMNVLLYCDLFGEFVNPETATDEDAECDFYEYDCNDDTSERP